MVHASTIASTEAPGRQSACSSDPAGSVAASAVALVPRRARGAGRSPYSDADESGDGEAMRLPRRPRRGASSDESLSGAVTARGARARRERVGVALASPSSPEEASLGGGVRADFLPEPLGAERPAAAGSKLLPGLGVFVRGRSGLRAALGRDALRVGAKSSRAASASAAPATLLLRLLVRGARGGVAVACAAVAILPVRIAQCTHSSLLRRGRRADMKPCLVVVFV